MTHASLAALPPVRVLAADCPWLFDDKLPGKSRGASRNYRCLSVEEICRFPLPPLLDDAWLLLWYVTSMIEEARAVCRAWGFQPSGAELVWVKTTGPGETVLDPMAIGAERAGHKGTLLAFGMGHTLRNCDERVLIGKRGRPERASASVRSVFFSPAGRHSEKPDRFFAIAEQLCGPGPRVELFARQRRPGWIGYGDELPDDELAFFRDWTGGRSARSK